MKAEPKLFNYATGPVQLSNDVLSAMIRTYSSGHMTDGQSLITETVDLVHDELSLSDDFIVLLLPGSIRAALERIIRSLVLPDRKVVGITAGYWSDFLIDCARREHCTVVRHACADGSPLCSDLDVLLTTHVETEFGEILPTDKFGREARAYGAIVVADLACSVPIDPLDPACYDIAILGSHKTLGGPPGLGVVAARKKVLPRLRSPHAHWDIPAYIDDAEQRYALIRGASKVFAPPPPAVTYPIQVVAGLHAALRERRESPKYSPDLHRQAAAAIRHGLAEAGLEPHEGEWPLSDAVVRIDVPPPLREHEIRQRLLDNSGIFIVGNVGRSTGTSVRIGTMSTSQVDPSNVDWLVEEFARALGTQRLAPA